MRKAKYFAANGLVPPKCPLRISGQINLISNGLR